MDIPDPKLCPDYWDTKSIFYFLVLSLFRVIVISVLIIGTHHLQQLCMMIATMMMATMIQRQFREAQHADCVNRLSNKMLL